MGRGQDNSISKRAKLRDAFTSKCVRCASALNTWLCDSDHFCRFENTGEIFPRGTTGRHLDLRSVFHG